MLGRFNVWQIAELKVASKFGKWIDLAIIIVIIWLDEVWRTTYDLPNTNFPTAKHSRHMVLFSNKELPNQLDAGILHQYHLYLHNSLL